MLVALAISPALAAVFTWDGTDGALWNDASHWLDANGNPGTMPVAGDVANVNSGTVYTNTTAINAQLNINTGGQLGIGGGWPWTTDLHINGGMLVNAPSPSGLNGAMFIDSHSYINASLGAGLYTTLKGSGDIEKIDASATALVKANPDFAGRYIVSSGTLRFTDLGGPGNAPIILRNNSQVTLYKDDRWVLTGDVSGTGSLTYGHQNALSGVTFSGCSVNPGEDAAGILTCEPFNGWGWGDVVFAANGDKHSQLVIDVISSGGVAGTDYDQLAISSNQNLPANNKVSLDPGADSADLLIRVADSLTAADMAGQTLTIAKVADGGTVKGTFANVTWTGPIRALITYNATTITLSDWHVQGPPAAVTDLAATATDWSALQTDLDRSGRLAARGRRLL